MAKTENKKNMNSGDCFASIYDAVSRVCRYEAEPFPFSVRSAHGEIVMLRSPEGSWIERISYESVGSSRMILRWPQAIHSNPLIEWSIRHFVISRMKSRIDTRPSNAVINAANSLDADGLTTPAKLGAAIGVWARSLLEKARDENLSDLRQGLRAYIDYCADSDVAGFDDATWTYINRLSLPVRDKEKYLSMFDEDTGPFTAAELVSINDAVRNSTMVNPPEKAVILLCRDWGLRPIQIALLAIEDFNEDKGGPFVLVPSVKGRVHSKMRRHAANRHKRYIADDTAQAIRDTLSWYAPEVDRALADIAAITHEADGFPSVDHPIFPKFRSEMNLSRFLRDRSLRPYALTTSSHAISLRLRELTSKLALPGGEDGAGFLEISAMRFRYTKGMMLALQGYPVEYIAEALDHQSLCSVKHYCRYSMQLADYMNSVANRSPEIKEASNLWQGKILTAKQVSQCISKGERAVAGLGICKKVGSCEFWPTVTCYSCYRFRPSREADHRQAAEHIAAEKKAYEVAAGKSSSNEFQVAYDRAIALAKEIERERGDV